MASPPSTFRFLDLPKELQCKILAIVVTPPAKDNDTAHNKDKPLGMPSLRLRPLLVNVRCASRYFHALALKSYFTVNQLTAVLHDTSVLSDDPPIDLGNGQLLHLRKTITIVREGTFEEHPIYQRMVVKLKVSSNGLWFGSNASRFVSKVEGMVELCGALTELTVSFKNVKVELAGTIAKGLKERIDKTAAKRNNKMRLLFVDSPQKDCYGR